MSQSPVVAEPAIGLQVVGLGLLGLQRDPQVPVLQLPERFEHLERHVRVGSILHVQADEEPVMSGRIDDPPKVVDARRAVDVDAKLGQLQ